MKHCPKPPTHDAVLAAIGAATSAAVLAELRTATAFFTGNQREALEAAIEERRRALRDGEDLGRDCDTAGRLRDAARLRRSR